MQRPILILAVLAFAGCERHHALVAPELPDGAIRTPYPGQIVTGVTVSPRTFRPGESARIEVSVRNSGPYAVMLFFSSGCMIGFHVNDSEGELVAPIGVICTMDAPQLRLEAGESLTGWFTWNGDRYDPLTGEFRPLSPGMYEVTGGLGELGFSHPSEPVTVELLAP